MRTRLAERIALFLGGFVLFLMGCLVGSQTGSQKTLLHVFVYTPLQGATQQDFQNFQQATEDMVGKIPGLKRVWLGKLREPIPAANDQVRTLGVAMEFADVQALDAYAANPVHREWEQIYEKVRVQGTTTIDLLPQ